MTLRVGHQSELSKVLAEPRGQERCPGTRDTGADVSRLARLGVPSRKSQPKKGQR